MHLFVFGHRAFVGSWTMLYGIICHVQFLRLTCCCCLDATLSIIMYGQIALHVHVGL